MSLEQRGPRTLAEHLAVAVAQRLQDNGPAVDGVGRFFAAVGGAAIAISTAVTSTIEQKEVELANAALAEQRARIKAWKPRDIERIRQLDKMVAAEHRLTPGERAWCEAVLAKRGKGRPGAPQRLTGQEQIARLIAWTRMPVSNKAERVARLKASPMYERRLTEMHESRSAYLKASKRALKPSDQALEEVCGMYGICQTTFKEARAAYRVRMRAYVAAGGTVAPNKPDPEQFERHRRWLEHGPSTSEDGRNF